MEKVFGATERHDQLLVFGTNRAVLIYGYGEEDGQGFDYRHVFDHNPTKEEVHDVLIAHIDACTDEKILTGWRWQILHGEDAGKIAKVWLSAENQTNYKSCHDAVHDYPELVEFPIRYKVGEDSDRKALYENFENLQELAQFYLGGTAYIRATLTAGWIEKDGLDMTVFGYE